MYQSNFPVKTQFFIRNSISVVKQKSFRLRLTLCAFQQATQCNIMIMSSLFNIGKQQGCNDPLCHTVSFVSLVERHTLYILLWLEYKINKKVIKIKTNYKIWKCFLTFCCMIIAILLIISVIAINIHVKTFNLY